MGEKGRLCSLITVPYLIKHKMEAIKPYLGWIIALIFVLMMFIVQRPMLKVILAALGGIALGSSLGFKTISLPKLNQGSSPANSGNTGLKQLLASL